MFKRFFFIFIVLILLSNFAYGFYKIEYSGNNGKIVINDFEVNVEFIKAKEENSKYFLLFSEKLIMIYLEFLKFFPRELVDENAFIRDFIIFENTIEETSLVYTKISENKYVIKNKFPISIENERFNCDNFMFAIHEIFEIYLSLNIPAKKIHRETRLFFDGLSYFYACYFSQLIMDDKNFNESHNSKSVLREIDSTYKTIDLKEFQYGDMEKINEILETGKSLDDIEDYEFSMVGEYKHYCASYVLFAYIIKDNEDEFLHKLIEELKKLDELDNEIIFRILKKISGYDVETWYKDFPGFWKKHKRKIRKIILK